MSGLPLLVSGTLALLVIALALFAVTGFASLLKGCAALRRNLRATSTDYSSTLLKSPIVPGVSVICVPPDVGPESRALVRRLLNLTFGKHEVVMVLEAPSEVEIERWKQEFHLFRQERVVAEVVPGSDIRGYYLSRDPIRLLVVEKEAGGVADAFHAGVNAAQFPVIGLVDEEAEFIPEILLRLIRPMLGDWEHTVGVVGVAPPPPAPGLAGYIGAIEDLRLFLSRCAAFSAWNQLLPVPGAFVLVKREAIRAVGGFRAGAVELFLDLHAAGRANRGGCRVALLATPVSFRPAATKWGDLRRRAGNDQRQLVAALGRSGGGARHGFRSLFLSRGLRPVLETAAYALAAAGWATGMVTPALAGLAVVTGVGGGMVTSMGAVVLREMAEPSGITPGRLVGLFVAAALENLGYRQVRNLWLMAGYFGSSAPKRNRGHVVVAGAPAMVTAKKK